MFSYKTSGVCSSTINLEIKNNIVEDVEFIGGCSGNLLGIGHLVKGMPVDDVIEKLKGIDCRNRGTSCPDQLSKALLSWKEKSI
ncbi:TIGR03905 family TSCPD domain-containing protein [Clostridium chromiireducens]|uniref:ribonucleoside-diphosphate reductase n=1 Tax=Clostridium chromiireducens TaxID=225345 RepID=A0A1V4IR94_9CLOT|nr:TIGR03905 family TSCPD domain-containing protein [Clostridium chromiireducens]MVX64616.1 TIGR03905 family TSCPD domain-containing protein [Clostridium chromiireducens]OPJ62324.1 TSCPD domain protein [Clostridium chromiireducens]RII34573.1 TIGR03905 family TSCPD domain-containing protein [Clostridium chromiireducens]